MELRETEPLGVLDHHDRGVGDVDTYFHDRGGDENLHFVFAETLHDFIFFFAGEAAMQEAEAQFGKNLAGEALVFFHGGFQFNL